MQEILLWGKDTAWSAEIVPQAAATYIHLKSGSVRIMLSEEDRLRLAAPNAEGVYFQCEGDPNLRYYIEKDFPCAHPRSAGAKEPPQETFEPPADFEERKTVPLADTSDG